MSNIAFELFAKLGLDSTEYENGLGNAKSIAGTVGKGIKTAFSVGTKAIGAATAAVGAFGLASVKGYAEYEQLVGGVDKLYGEASGKLQQYANEAYKTAGMSANAYMETATSFSAALINSLDGDLDAAANMTDVAMRAISDNVNTFGSDFQSVQNAFQGFAKGQMNMLDNLKLGYGGTKEEMERLLRDAEQYEGYIEGSLSIDNFSDIIEGIQIVQEHLNVAGTTEKEAMKTIEGSAAATKAAWQNVITAIAGGGDLGQAFDGLITSIFGKEEGEGFLNQVIPRIETTMEGIGTFIEKAAPYVTEKLPALVSSILPGAITSGITLLQAIGKGIIDSLPTLLGTAKTIIVTLGKSLIDNAPSMFSAITSVIVQIATMLTENASALVQGAISMILTIGQSLIDSLPVLIPAIVELMIAVNKALLENAPLLLQGLLQLVVSLAQALIEYAPYLITAWLSMYQMMGDYLVQWGASILAQIQAWFTNLASQASEWIGNTINVIIEWLSQLPEKMAYYAGVAVGMFVKFLADLPKNVTAIFVDIIGKIVTFGSSLKTNAENAGKSFFNGIVDNLKNLPSRVAQLAVQLVKTVSELPKKFAEIGLNIVTGLWNGISGAWSGLVEKVGGLFGNFVDGIKDGLGIHSPSRLFHWMGEMIDKGLANGIADNMGLVDKSMDGLMNYATISPSISTTTNAQGVTLNDIIRLLQEIASSNKNVTVVLEGDADRLFRVVQHESHKYKQTTGQEAFGY